MDLDEFQVLVIHLVENEELDPKDKPRIKKVIYQLSMDELDRSPKDQNSRWADQQRMEASIIYLVGKYSDYVIAAKRNLEDAKDDERLDLPEKDGETNRKYNKDDREALINRSADVHDKRDQLDALQSLLRDLIKLEQTIIRRNDKLNDVSINIRRDKEVDERST